MREELGDLREQCKLCSFQLGLRTAKAAKFQLLSPKASHISCILPEGCFPGTCSMLELSGVRIWHRNSGRALRGGGGCMGLPRLVDLVQGLCFPVP